MRVGQSTSHRSLQSPDVDVLQGNKRRHEVRDATGTLQPAQAGRNDTSSNRSNFSHEANIASLLEQGVQLHRKGEYDGALRSFEEALEKQVVCLGERHPNIAQTHANIGAVYLRQNRLQQAGKSLQEALDVMMTLRESTSGEKEKSKYPIYEILNNLGNVAYLQGNYSMSMHFYRFAMRELRSPHRPGTKTELASVLHNIGRLHALREEWDAALKVLKQCHELEKEVHGPGSPMVGDTLELLGYVYFSLEELDHAMISFSGALSVRQNTLEAVHEDIGTVLVHIAMVLEKKGQLENSRRVYTTARTVLKKVGVRKDHVVLTSTYRSIKQLEARIKQEESNEDPVMFVPIDLAERDEQNSFGEKRTSSCNSTDTRQLD